MKKMYFSVLLAALGMNAQAQVFQRLYGTTVNDVLSDGHNTNLGGLNGHFLVSPMSATPYAFSATRTNSSGIAIPAGGPYFSNQYRISDVPLPSGAANLRIGEVRSVQQQTGNGYSIAGSYVRGGSSNNIGVFYQALGVKGNLSGTAIGYFVGAGSPGYYNDIHVTRIINSALTPGDMYILGMVRETSSGRNRAFVLRIDASGALVWSRIYVSVTASSDVPYDIVESTQMRGTNYEVIVVGSTTVSGQSDGFLMRINYLTGSLIGTVQLYGSSATDEHFTCIRNTQNPMADPSGAGYVIGGEAGNGTNTDYWFAGIDQGGSVSWSNTFDYNGTGASADDHCSDLVEYNRAPGMYEYYLGGYTNKGIFGGDDAVVIHTDQAGNMLPGGQFTYGTTNTQRCLRIDQDNNPVTGGIAMYGSAQDPTVAAPLGAYDQYLVKADFMGNTSCNDDRRDGIQGSGPGLYSSRTGDHTNLFTSYTMYSRVIGVLDEGDACGGSGCNSPRPPLVAHWNFTGGSLVDGVSGLTGVINGGVTPAPGLLGLPNTAYRFDGATGYIQVPSSPNLDLQSWTLTALVQPNGFYNGDCESNAIVWRGTQFSTDAYAMMIFDNAMDSTCGIFTPSGELAAGFPAGNVPLGTAYANWRGAVPCVTNPCINPGNWYCIWLSYDAISGNLDLYVNGVYRVTLNWPNQYGPPVINDLFIGSSNMLGTFPYFFNGVIDDIAIYGGPLLCPLDCTDPENGLARKTASGIGVLAGSDITALPNPTTGNVELTTSDAWKDGTVVVLNVMGQEISRQRVAASGKTAIDLSAVPAGLYLIRTQLKDQYTVKKVIKN